jgi:hypothetical protein
MKSVYLVGCGWMLAFAVLAGCNKEPFSQVRASGKVVYEDGTPIPVDKLMLKFYPEAGPKDAKTYPRPGSAIVDKATGSFDAVTTHKYGDGLVAGKHKVTLWSPSGVPKSAVPPEYCNLDRTPLEVDTANVPFELKIKKP